MDRKLFVIFGIFILAFASFVSADVISVNSGGGNSVIINPTKLIEGFFFQSNEEPMDPNPVLISENGRNETTADLLCGFDVLDVDSDFLNVSVNWIKDGASQFILEYNNIVNGTDYDSRLLMNNLTLGDVWKCSVRYYDGIDYSNWVDSNELEIIDITAPNITIISPEPINYSTVEVPFNVTINENVSLCYYDLDFKGNISMNMLNSTYFWEQDDTIGPGDHDVYFYCRDPSGNWGMNFTNFTVLEEAAIAIILSDDLLEQVRWNVVTLPINDLGAIGNNFDEATNYFMNISATNTLVDIYVRADGDLLTEGLDRIGLGNETFAISFNDSTVSNGYRLYSYRGWS